MRIGWEWGGNRLEWVGNGELNGNWWELVRLGGKLGGNGNWVRIGWELDGIGWKLAGIGNWWEFGGIQERTEGSWNNKQTTVQSGHVAPFKN